MGKLDDIPRKQIFSVPEDYFDELPSRIQSRIAATPVDKAVPPVFRYTLQYALPLILIAAIAFFYIGHEPDAGSILATVATEDLLYYLEDSPLTTEDLLESVDFSRGDLEAIENEVYDLELGDLDDEQIDEELNAL